MLSSISQQCRWKQSPLLSPGPEPATEMVFSNVTESSLSVSWSKPKTTYAAFRITYTNIVTGLFKCCQYPRYKKHSIIDQLTSTNCLYLPVLIRGVPLCDRELSAISCGSQQVICRNLLHSFCHGYTRQNPE